ncbi:MAG: 4-hydroxy-3-methylbut-2-enyl diphosphate reductase [Lentisphaerae bacterium]|nr:4-hydroxy-3-methylbut-2-enyl diphosphate reductase [Lentisphaerota bacterium]
MPSSGSTATPEGGGLVLLAAPRGFCAGVQRAVEMMDAALSRMIPPVYCLREIVHNRQVVEMYRLRGVRFVPSLDEVPERATIVFSAHGVAPDVRAEAERRGMRIVDATCPFVTKVHSEVKRYARNGYSIVMIGHRRHDEVLGVAGEAPGAVAVVENEAEAASFTPADPDRVAVVTQTTLSQSETEHVTAVLKSRFPSLERPVKDDVCYATTNRQKAVRELARRCALIVVLGSRNSSNTLRLAEVAKSAGTRAEVVSTLAELAELPLDPASALGMTAGASTPDSMVEQALQHLRARGFGEVRELKVTDEDLRFPLPRELRD